VKAWNFPLAVNEHEREEEFEQYLVKLKWYQIMDLSISQEATGSL
jgi:hypothetical protein